MVTRALAAAAGCFHGRSTVLRLLVSQSQNIIRPTASTYVAIRASSTTFRRAFSSLPDNKFPPAEDEDTSPSLTRLQDATETTDADASGTPWYLQVQPPRHAPAAETPVIPELPAGSPSILEPLLKYVSEELGLDDLSLLDLRQLDPPPALGQDLIMLFGTARSERHLHVSAGRFVRYLRAKHKIRADADGLLGPNERKIKLRRKAKRAKLLGTSGTDDRDDGISTGWICVNLGTVGRGGGETVVQKDGRVAGFGVQQAGTTLVVQIMTETRRAELDLETLWNRALKRTQQANERSGAISAAWDNDTSSQTAKASSFPSQRVDSVSPSSSRQVRYYSAMPERGAESTASQATSDLFGFKNPADLTESLTHDGHAKMMIVRALGRYVSDQNHELGGRSKLWETINELESSQLLARASRNLPQSATFADRASILYQARLCGHPAYGLEKVREIVEELQLSGLEVDRNQAVELLSSIFHGPENSPNLMREQSDLAISLLETFFQRGQQVIAYDVLAAMIHGIASSGATGTTYRNLQERLESLMLHSELGCPEEHTVQHLMDAYSLQHDWEKLWGAWRLRPRYLQPRSRGLYNFMFSCVAASGNQSLCIEALRRYFPEMLNENPQVLPQGEVLQNIMACLRVADPEAEDIAARLRESNAADEGLNTHTTRIMKREFVKLARQLHEYRRSQPESY